MQRKQHKNPMLRGIPSPTPRSRHTIRSRGRIQLFVVELTALRGVQKPPNSVTMILSHIGFAAHVHDWPFSSINLSISSMARQGCTQSHYIHVVSASNHPHRPRKLVLRHPTQDHRKALPLTTTRLQPSPSFMVIPTLLPAGSWPSNAVTI